MIPLEEILYLKKEYSVNPIDIKKKLIELFERREIRSVDDFSKDGRRIIQKYGLSLNDVLEQYKSTQASLDNWDIGAYLQETGFDSETTLEPEIDPNGEAVYSRLGESVKEKSPLLEKEYPLITPGFLVIAHEWKHLREGELVLVYDRVYEEIPRVSRYAIRNIQEFEKRLESLPEFIDRSQSQ